MSLCQSIDTLSMAFLDDELAAEERRELELHLLDCAACRQHVATERSELDTLRKALAAPPATDIFKARLARALDAEEAQVARTERRRWSQYVLPGTAMLAAVGAIALFVGVGAGGTETGAVASDAMIQARKNHPLEVKGPLATVGWLDQNFPGAPPPPQFTTGGVELVGARLTVANGHDAALLTYRVDLGDAHFQFSALVVRDVHDGELGGGEEVDVGDRTVHVLERGGMAAVTYVDGEHMGYVFTSDRLSPKQLLNLVVTSDLIGRAQRGG